MNTFVYESKVHWSGSSESELLVQKQLGTDREHHSRFE